MSTNAFSSEMEVALTPILDSKGVKSRANAFKWNQNAKTAGASETA